MKKFIALLLVFVLSLLLCACGGNTDTPETPTNAPAGADIETTTSAPVSKAEKIGFNEKISLDFVEMSFTECTIKEDARTTITNYDGIKVTRTFGPSPEDGKQFVCLNGKIKCTAKEEIPVYDFFIGELDIDGYKFEVTANDCDVYTSNGNVESSVPALTEYDFVICVGIPDELANSHSAINFTFGFYDMFDNEELSYNKAFEDEPISLCPYQYTIAIK